MPKTATTHVSSDLRSLDLAAFAEGLSDPFCVLDTDYNLLIANSSFNEFCPDGERFEQTLTKMQLHEHLEFVFKKQKGLTLHDHKLFSGDSKTFAIEIHTFEDPSDNATLASIRILNRQNQSAVAERKKRSDEIHKLNLIAAGLAHEIRNPLFAIQGAAEILSKKIKSQQAGETESLCLDVIKKESARINKLVGELMNLSKPKTLEFCEININELIHDILQTTKLQRPDEIQIRDIIDPSLPPILGDTETLRQAIGNVVQNAIDAIKTSGHVEVRTQYVTDFVMRTEDGKRQFLCVQVEDNGPGMNDEELKNIFTPYYTTKSKGTGLGLAIAQQAIETHGGRILVKSRPHHGTLFSIYLPMHL